MPGTDRADLTLAALREDDLRALVEVSRELAGETHLPRLLHRILERATALTDSPDGSVILYDDARACLYFADAVGPHADYLLTRFGAGGEPVPVVGSKAGQTFTALSTEVVEAVPDDPNHFKGVDEATKSPTASMVSVPLVATSRRTGLPRPIGVMQILNKRSGDYTRRDRILLERFADQAAVTIENATLVGDLFAHMGLDASWGADPQQMLERPAWSERVTVMFADLRGFTQLCQVIGRPERAQTMLNELLTMLSGEVAARGGVVNKFLGDGLMAFFRQPADGAVNAVRCSFSMLAAFDLLKGVWDEDSNVRLSFLDLGIGISTEDVILGSVGNGRVLDFTAIGTGVNLAAYLMDHARDGKRILVDKVTFRAAKNEVEAFEPLEVDLKKTGQTVAHPYECYWLKDAKGTSRPAAPVAPVTDATSPGSVFVSYSHHDKPWFGHLQTHLAPYVHGGSMAVWNDTMIGAGDDWRAAIKAALAQARVAVLLVSPHFLASDFIRRNELPPLLDAARTRGLKIVWVPVAASSYEETPIARLQAASNPSAPLDGMQPSELNQCLVNVCKVIKGAMISRA